ncbi:MAG TPA: prephenate dehydrogenase [Saprospiraceae bacterium]|nr:prephenate dehydrogenase [Saprospiraceae bacterium]HNT18809.1 prephenate dehydrogenase [Saprospiraceae bacterium]
MSRLCLIGVGHIGGSLALAGKKAGLFSKVTGVDVDPDNLEKALSLGLIEEALPLAEAINGSDLVVLAVPVNVMVNLIPQVLDLVDDQLVTEVGSTKTAILKSIAQHPKRKQFVASHPMAGTEFSGPESAQANLFTGKTCVLVDTADSDPEKVKQLENVYSEINMRLVYLDSESHDLHAAYVSHISHISSFALALTVLAKEKDENQIFQLASGGFSSTVRLAKSSPDMWIPIFEQNRDNVLDVLDEHISTLSRFRSLLIKRDFKTFRHLIEEANQIKKILKT